MYRIKKQIRVMLMSVLVLAGIFVCGTTVWAASADNSLASLSLSQGNLSPSFVYNVVNYQVSVDNSVSSIEVQARTSHELASIQSGVGTHQLKEGTNTIKVQVAAENGNVAVYTITVTRAESSQASQESAGEDKPVGNEDGSVDAGETQSTDETQDTDAQDSPENDGEDAASAITGADGYTVAEMIPEEMVPAGFTQTLVNYQDGEYPALQFDKGDIILLYMLNEQGEGMLFHYERTSGEVYPFIKLSAGNSYLMVLQAPPEAGLGENYIPATLTIENKNVPTAFRYAEAENTDFYLIYGMNSEGMADWYQYDDAEGTYQRYQEITEAESDITENEEYQFLQTAYNDLSKKYSELKQRDTKYMAILIIVIAILLIAIVNILLLKRERKYTKEEAVSNREEESVKKPKKTRVQAKKKDFIDDFEEEPDFLSGNKGKEKKEELPAKQTKKRSKRREDIFDDNNVDDFFDEEAPLIETRLKDAVSLDDDLEILDLNDL